MSVSANVTSAMPSIAESQVDRMNAIAFRPFGITIGLWSVFVGSFGNMLTILTYIANKKLRTTFNMFLLNLAVIDFLTATCMLPFNVAGYVQMEWPFGNDSFTTRLQAFSYFCCGYSSVVFLIAITVNRFVGAMYPAKYKVWFSKERMVWILLISNIFAPAFLLPFLIGIHPSCTSPMQSLTGYNTKQFLCTFVCLTKEMAHTWNVYMQVVRVLFQFVPLILMIIMYSIIFISVHRKRTDLSSRMSTMKSSAFSAKEDSSSTKQNNGQGRKLSTTLKRRKKEDGRMLLISVVVCVAFMITFLPSVIINLFPLSFRTAMDSRWHMAASNLTWFNSSLNPLIYVLLNRRFRREYWRIILMAVGKVKGKFVHESLSTGAGTIVLQANAGGTNTSEDETSRLRTNV